jgi:hypothetical protein
VLSESFFRSITLLTLPENSIILLNALPFSTSDAWALRAMFEEFKFLAHPFNFIPQRKRK